MAWRQSQGVSRTLEACSLRPKMISLGSWLASLFSVPQFSASAKHIIDIIKSDEQRGLEHDYYMRHGVLQA